MALQRQSTLSKETSQVFHMALDEIQSTVAGSGKLASMNIEEFLSTVWDHQAGGTASLGAEPSPSLPLFSEGLQPGSLPLPASSGAGGGLQDYSGKTTDEVWQAIQASKAAAGAFEPVKLGSVLQSLDMQSALGSDAQLAGLPMPASSHLLLKEPAAVSLSIPCHSAALASHELRLEDLGGAGLAQPHGEVHAVATIRVGGAGPGGPQPKGGRPRRRAAAAAMTLSPPDSPAGEMPEIEAPPAGAHSRVARSRKRKEPEVVDERTARQAKRMVKNRESAARSRARKQEYTAQLEARVAKLQRENRALLEKLVRQCPPVAGTPRPAAAPLRRTRTMPTPALRALAESVAQ